jgi:hypothetical protein
MLLNNIGQNTGNIQPEINNPNNQFLTNPNLNSNNANNSNNGNSNNSGNNFTDDQFLFE